MKYDPLNSVSGFIAVLKPKGWSSNQLLSKLKWLFKTKKAGHGGTLDPFATGIVPVFFGEATKFSGRFLDSDKEYQAQLKLGFESSTGDTEGEITKDNDFVYEQLPDNISEIIQEFEGPQSQTPPIYSALKYKGKPYYQYAREGKSVPIKKRQIIINNINLVSFSKNTLIFDVSCTKGTYIRTLGEDIAKRLGTKGYLTELQRTRIGKTSKEDAYAIEDIETIDFDKRVKLLTSIEKMLQISLLELDSNQMQQILNGQLIELTSIPGEYALMNQKKFLGIGQSDGNFVKPIRLIKMK
ncbi:MAG: tRNA pseudouridine(55) synthase TruB [Methylophilaceae bacterium]|jgi:tRNA pseudouridine55 synthase